MDSQTQLTYKVKVDFKYGDAVYHIADKDQIKMIVCYYLCSEDSVSYGCRRFGSEGSDIYYYNGYELSKEEDMSYKIKS